MKPSTVTEVRCAPLALMVCACATVAPLEALERDASFCTDFSQLEARASDLATELEVRPRVDAARVACARHVVENLLALREGRGAEAAQRELDAIAMALPDETFADVINHSTADPNVLVMAKLAAETAVVERLNRRRTSPELRQLDAEGARVTRETAEAAGERCATVAGPDALDCLVEAGAPELAVRTMALRLLERLQVDDAWPRTVQLGALANRLAQRSLEVPEVQRALSASHRAHWPSIAEEAARGHLERAAVKAGSFRTVPSARDDVVQLERAATLNQLEAAARAEQRSPFAAAFHRALATTFERHDAAKVTWPSALSTWDVERFQACPGQTLKPLPESRGLAFRLLGRCVQTKRASESAKSDAANRIFENEAALEWQDVAGQLFVTCDEKLSVYPIRARELLHDPAQERSPMRFALEKAVSAAVADCAVHRARELGQRCEALADDDETVERFARSALATGRWHECFVRLVADRWGVQLSPRQFLPEP